MDPTRSTFVFSHDWVQGKSKWPHQAEQTLRRLMIKHQFYTYHKLDHDSRNKLADLMEDVRGHIYPNGWTPALDLVLEAKVIGKLTRIRGAMIDSKELVKVNDRYVLGEDRALAHGDALDHFSKAVTGLDRDQVAEALRLLFVAADPKSVHLAYANWVLRLPP